MKLKFISSLIILVLGLTQFGCSIGSPAVPSPVGLMTAKLNGVNWVSTKDTCYYRSGTTIPLGGMSDSLRNALTVRKSYLGFRSENLTDILGCGIMYFNSLDPHIFIGNYDLNGISESASFFYQSKSFPTDCYDAINGNIRITFVDSASRTISGTFDCIMINVSHMPRDTVRITDAVFTGSYYEHFYFTSYQ